MEAGKNDASKNKITCVLKQFDEHFIVSTYTCLKIFKEQRITFNNTIPLHKLVPTRIKSIVESILQELQM